MQQRTRTQPLPTLLQQPAQVAGLGTVRLLQQQQARAGAQVALQQPELDPAAAGAGPSAAVAGPPAGRPPGAAAAADVVAAPGPRG
ncbi:hypothetical protein G6F32_015848 [Rhizopus arrhizus]|nr:hypothetical protein G6F32_015848 [Rhizopus arrhizus]